MAEAADLALVVRLQHPLLALTSAKPWAEVRAAKPDAAGYRRQADAAARGGDHAGAARIYAEGVAAHPQDADLLNAAAWQLVTCPPQHRQPEPAVRWAAEAVRLTRGRRTHIRDTLAEALLVAGRLDEAQAENEALLTLQPEDEDCLKRRDRIAAARAAK